MKLSTKASLYKHLNSQNARVVYLVLAIVALVLGAGAPDAFGLGGPGGGG